jgi:transcriptional regulator with XRE-family HTH domain
LADTPSPAAALLRRARQHAGITQAELARRAGMAAPTISAYETGRRDPSVSNLVRLLDAAGLDLALQESMRTHRGRRLEQVLDLASVLPRWGRDEKPDLPSWNDLVRPELRRGA